MNIMDRLAPSCIVLDELFKPCTAKANPSRPVGIPTSYCDFHAHNILTDYRVLADECIQRRVAIGALEAYKRELGKSVRGGGHGCEM